MYCNQLNFPKHNEALHHSPPSHHQKPTYQPNCSQCSVIVLPEFATRSATTLRVSLMRLSGPQAATIDLSCSSVAPTIERMAALISGRPSITGSVDSRVVGEQLPDAFSGSESTLYFSEFDSFAVAFSTVCCSLPEVLASRARVTWIVSFTRGEKLNSMSSFSNHSFISLFLLA